VSAACVWTGDDEETANEALGDLIDEPIEGKADPILRSVGGVCGGSVADDSGGTSGVDGKAEKARGLKNWHAVSSALAHRFASRM
jgi:hypothetical protein